MNPVVVLLLFGAGLWLLRRSAPGDEQEPDSEATQGPMQPETEADTAPGPSGPEPPFAPGPSAPEVQPVVQPDADVFMVIQKLCTGIVQQITTEAADNFRLEIAPGDGYQLDIHIVAAGQEPVFPLRNPSVLWGVTVNTLAEDAPPWFRIVWTRDGVDVSKRTFELDPLCSSAPSGASVQGLP